MLHVGPHKMSLMSPFTDAWKEALCLRKAFPQLGKSLFHSISGDWLNFISILMIFKSFIKKFKSFEIVS